MSSLPTTNSTIPTTLATPGPSIANASATISTIFAGTASLPTCSGLACISGSTTLSSDATAPTSSRNCQPNTVRSPPLANTINAVPVTNNSISVMQACCGTNPVVLWRGGCNMYCTAPNATATDQINSCLRNNGGSLTLWVESGPENSAPAVTARLTSVFLSALLVGAMLVGF